VADPGQPPPRLALFFARPIAPDKDARMDPNAATDKEDRLQQEVELLRLMLDGVKDYAIFMLDPDGRVTTWNGGANKGYTAQEIIGRHFSCFYRREDVDAGKPQRELEVARAVGRYEEDGWRVRKDGSTFWANVLITAVFDRAGSLRGFAKVTRDVTQVRRLQVELGETNSRLRQVNDRMSRDLESAAQIQRTFLPEESISFPGVAFAWSYQPCDELAGDGLNIVPLGDGRVAVYILDVSGHGVASALMSVSVSRLLSVPSQPSSILVDRAAGRLDVTRPGAVAGLLNRLFPFSSETTQFATLLYGIFDSATGEFCYVSAGHPGPILARAGGTPVPLHCAGFPIGLADEPYEERCVHLAPGDRLYLYSDGLPDAMSSAGDRFGDARLVAAIGRAQFKPLADGIAALLRDVVQWRGEERAHDDISILALELSSASVADRAPYPVVQEVA
jgi:sigma-B regulation protein RsbU (phosphoserine phosphatase)